MVMHSHGLAPAFLEMADAVLRANSLPPALRELAIVRVGHTYAAAYEIHHHERIGRAVGMTDAAIEAARTGDTAGVTELERLVLRWTDTLLADHALVGADRDDALATLGVEHVADLVLTVGFYQLVCNFLNTFHVTTDGETPPRLPRTTPTATTDRKSRLR